MYEPVCRACHLKASSEIKKYTDRGEMDKVSRKVRRAMHLSDNEDATILDA